MFDGYSSSAFAYDEMYDARSSSAATGRYSDAKEAFHDAIAIACELELPDEMAAIQARRDPLVSGREGLLTTEMLEAAERSFASGEAVDLPLGASTAPR